jgi:ATP-dependent exoDNAse (exonuclease V) beta subunit
MASTIVPDYRAADSAPNGIVADIAESMIAQVAQPGDAVLSRTNAPLMPLCLSLLRKGVSARIEGRDIGKQLASIVEKLKARSVPQFIQRIENWGAKQIARFSKSKHAVAKTEQINDQVSTLVAVAEGASSVAEIKERLLNLFQDSDGNAKPAVVLSSVHKAKGLEWGKVFILSRSFKKATTEGEEANIYYVAITRAKSELFLASEDAPEKN